MAVAKKPLLTSKKKSSHSSAALSKKEGKEEIAVKPATKRKKASSSLWPSGNPLFLISPSKRRSFYLPSMTLQEKIDFLIEKGICTPTMFSQDTCGGCVNTLSICKQFSMENHSAMVYDEDRVNYYRKGMRQASNVEGCVCAEKGETPSLSFISGMKVLEIGTGPHAILAINAITSGASYVDAIEVNDASAIMAKQTVDRLGFSNINVECCYSKEFPLVDKQYDVIVHEIIGDFVSQEGVADVLYDIHERLGYIPKSIPFAASTVVCPALFPEFEHILCPSNKYPERTIISPSRLLLQSVQLDFRTLQLADFQAFETLYFEKPLRGQLRQAQHLQFNIIQAGLMAGLLCAIDVEVRPSIFFGTRYLGQTDSWYTTIVLLPEEVAVYPDDIILVDTESSMKNYDTIPSSSLSRRKRIHHLQSSSSSSSSSAGGSGSSTCCSPPSSHHLNGGGGGSSPPTCSEGPLFVQVSKPEYSFVVTIKRKREGRVKVVKQFKGLKVTFLEQAPRIYSGVGGKP